VDLLVAAAHIRSVMAVTNIESIECSRSVFSREIDLVSACASSEHSTLV
jgi:hypothetical protein